MAASVVLIAGALVASARQKRPGDVEQPMVAVHRVDDATPHVVRLRCKKEAGFATTPCAHVLDDGLDAVLQLVFVTGELENVR